MKPSVLLVDDDVQLLRVFGRALSAAGHDVLLCDNAFDAMAELSDHRPQVVVTDWHMLPLGGQPWIDYLLELRAEQTFRLVIISGSCKDDQVPDVLLLRKPFTSATLLAAVSLPES